MIPDSTRSGQLEVTPLKRGLYDVDTRLFRDWIDAGSLVLWIAGVDQGLWLVLVEGRLGLIYPLA